MEIAATARQRGCEVTVIEGLDRVMARCLSQTMSDYLHSVHVANGVAIHCNAMLAADQNAPGHLLFDDGSRVAVDAVVVGIGAVPNAELAADSGLEVDGGIKVDRFTRTSDPDIHAAGDVTLFESDGAYHRAEHWRHAIDQARVAARVMAGAEEAYREEPWLWSDQYTLNIQITGSCHGDQDVVRGSTASDAFVVFHLDKGAVAGATAVNRAKFKRQIAALVSARARIEPLRLADEAIDLKSLAAEATAASAAATSVSA
jgi:NADPH-dependent 2,4-dienoyl-CoA reductase/sulfur reductase-like enzyme